MYEVYITKTAKSDLEKLSHSILERIASQIKALSQNPRPIGCKKIVGSKHDWRIRIGDYRVVYEINDSSRKIIVIRVRHRKEVYR